MNLLEERWLPVRSREGRTDWIAPHQLCDPRFVAFDANRADFNGALAQFAIGLLQTTTPIASETEWRQLFSTPPDSAALKQWFEPVREAFGLDGDGPRFMQDCSLSDGEPVGIASLLIETPGDNTLRNNSDHFVKRDRIDLLCPHCAATALLTLQINAPAGGAGHRTGLRGGGPLTTLVECQPSQSLWHDLWLNVRERAIYLAQGGDSALTEPHFSFPWLAPIEAIQKSGGETSPAQVHPAHVYWATPRRIRIDFAVSSEGRCDICLRPTQRLVSHYITRNYGLNYKGAWDHPLSPYYETKEGWLPVHPQPGGLGYRHWLAWIIGNDANGKKQRAARVVDHVLTHRSRQAGATLRIRAFGYDMDNMKARCWYESTLPLYGLTDCDRTTQQAVQAEVGVWVVAAEQCVFYLRSAVRAAWFGGDAQGDLSAVDASFWPATEPAFYKQLRALIDAARTATAFDSVNAAEAWLHTLVRTALRLFDDVLVGAGRVERQSPARTATAYQELRRNLYGRKMRNTLRLPANDGARSMRKADGKAA